MSLLFIEVESYRAVVMAHPAEIVGSVTARELIAGTCKETLGLV